MQIFILILKIIGILLAVFILLIGAALAVPVRYRVDAGIEQQKVSGRAVFFWIFHIIDCRIWYREDGMDYRLRIFGIPIAGLKQEKKDKSRKRKKKKPHKSKRNKIEKSGEKNQEQPRISDESVTEQPKISEENVTKQKASDNNKIPTGKNNKDRRRTKVRARKPKRKKFWRIRRFWDNLKQRFLDIMDGAVTAKEKIQNIKKMILDETNKSVFGQVWRELRILIRHYSPRRAKGELAFGMEDPSKTGQILGALSVLPFWTRYKINIYPNFQAEAFFVEGRLQMKGHIRLWHFLLSVIRLIKDKDVRLLLKRMRT